MEPLPSPHMEVPASAAAKPERFSISLKVRPSAATVNAAFRQIASWRHSGRRRQHMEFCRWVNALTRTVWRAADMAVNSYRRRKSEARLVAEYQNQTYEGVPLAPPGGVDQANSLCQRHRCIRRRRAVRCSAEAVVCAGRRCVTARGVQGGQTLKCCTDLRRFENTVARIPSVSRPTGMESQSSSGIQGSTPDLPIFSHYWPSQFEHLSF